MEAGNEPDKFWYDKEYQNKPEATWQMLPTQYAALLHAAYDGANKSASFELPPAGSGKFMGVKNIDPNMKMSMAGISDFRGKYYVDLLNKAESLRTAAARKVPFDILNIHHYTSTDVPKGALYLEDNFIWNPLNKFGFTSKSVGQSPEDADLKGRYIGFFTKLFDPNTGLSTTVKTQLSNFSTEYWVTELGYDTNNGSPLSTQVDRFFPAETPISTATVVPFTYNISATNSTGTAVTSNTATAKVTILPFGTSLFAVKDNVTTLKNTPITIKPLNNDVVLSQTVSSLTNTNPTSGTVSLIGNTFQYSPNTNFTGNDQFNYTVTTDLGGQSTATVAIAVRPTTATTPFANADNYATFPGKPISIDLLENDILFGNTLNKLAVVAAPTPATNTVALSGARSLYTTQAQWLVRTLLELSAVEHTVNSNKLFLSKATIFDMRDNGNYSGGASTQYSPDGVLYSHCGLITRDFKPKRSWYHVQTLIGVLGMHRFAKEVVSPDISFEGSTASDPKPRIYDYKNAAGEHILAIWSPTASMSNRKVLKLDVGTLKSAMGEPLSFQLNNFSIVTTKDFSERGSYKAFPLTNDKLVFDNTSSFISETPIYVLINKQITDAVFADCKLAPANGALTTTSFCDGVAINYGPVTATGKWRIVYALQSDVNAMLATMGKPSGCPAVDVAFDFLGDSRFKVYSDNFVPTQQSSVLINGLASSTAYVFFIFYTNNAGIVSAPCVVCASTNTSAPCFAPLCFQAIPNFSSGSCGTFTNDYKKLLINPTDDPNCLGTVNSGDPAAFVTCANMNATFPDDELWQFCDPYEVSVTFDNFVLLNAIKFYHGNGSDDIDIYYTCCSCTDKNYLTTYRPKNKTNHWVTIFENMPSVPIKQLYFRKVGRRGPNKAANFSIGKLHFCGFESQCTARPGSNIKGGVFETVKVDVSDERDVTISWAPVKLERDDPTKGVYQRYQAWVAPQTLGNPAQFDSENPIVVNYYPGTDEASFSVGKLPSGVYDALIRVPEPATGCAFAPRGDDYLQGTQHGLDVHAWADTVITFRISQFGLKQLGDERNQGETIVEIQKQATMSVFPNPTTGQLTVTWDAQGFESLEFWGLDGKLLLSHPLTTDQTMYQCNLDALPEGTYIARLRARSMSPRQKIVALVKP